MPDPEEYPEELQPYLDDFRDDIEALMADLESGAINLPGWRDRFADLLATYLLTGYFAGQLAADSVLESAGLPPAPTGAAVGGAAAAAGVAAGAGAIGALAAGRLLGEARAWLQNWLAGQIDYLDGFYGAIQANRDAGGEFTPAWNGRARMYATSIIAPFWYGATAGLPLPALPGDGSSDCGQADACGWVIDWIDRASGDADCYWRLNQTRVVTEHCQQCVERADKWNPLRVRAWRLDLPPVVKEVALKHLQGQHDQEAHGRRGAGETYSPIPSKDCYAFIRENRGAVADADNSRQGEALKYYMGTGYTEINQPLRNGESHSGMLPKEDAYRRNHPLSKREAVREIDRFTTLGKFPENTVVYRGVSAAGLGEYANNPQALKGKTIRDKGFISTTLDESVGRNFAKYYDFHHYSNEKPGAIFEIRVPKGTRAGMIPSSEREVILPRGSRFRVVDVIVKTVRLPSVYTGGPSSERQDIRVIMELFDPKRGKESAHALPGVVGEAETVNRFIWSSGEWEIEDDEARTEKHLRGAHDQKTHGGRATTPPNLPPELTRGTTKAIQDRNRERAEVMQQAYPGVKFSTAGNNPLGVAQARKAGMPGAGTPRAIFDPKAPAVSDPGKIAQVRESYAKLKKLSTPAGGMASGYLTFNNVKFDTGLPFQEVFGVLNHLRATAPASVRFTVDRLGQNTAFALPEVGKEFKTLKHLAGQHNQETHGHRGGAGYQPAKYTDPDHVPVVRDGVSILETDMKYQAQGDSFLKAIAVDQGFDGPATLVSNDEMDRLVKSGEVTEMHRGVAGERGADFAEAYRTGDFYVGRGVYGDGVYATPHRDLAMGYAGDNESGMLRMGLRKEARVGVYSEIKREMKERAEGDYWQIQKQINDLNDRFYAGGGTEALRNELMPEMQRLRDAQSVAMDRIRNADRRLGDVGRYAATRGYDAYQVDIDEVDHWIILNRTATYVVGAAQKEFKTLKHLPGKHDQSLHGQRGKTYQDLNPDEAVRWAERSFGSLANKATEAEVEALGDYIGQGYETINSYLRRGKPKYDGLLEEIDHLHALLDRSRVPDNVRVTRGANLTEDIIDQLKPGSVLQDKGFVSTTFDAAIADGFSASIGRDPTTRQDIIGRPVKFVIGVPKGSRGLFVFHRDNGKVEFSASESELLLQAGTRFRIKSRQQMEDYLEVHMEVINE